jgi:cyclopropane-fatty-acyl-phospholipid synthase
MNMAKNFYADFIKQLLAKAGIHINGSNPWDITVHNDAFYERVFKEGSIGLGESYMDGMWECKQLDELMYRIISTNLSEYIKWDFKKAILLIKAKLFNLQSISRSRDVAYKHYDIGNVLYESMLDSRMIYSCAYWENALTLDEAQEAKLDLICRKLKLKAGEMVVDIGCGWGGFARFAAENYQVNVLGITISEEQAKKAASLCAGLSVEIRIQDYRTLEGEFDKVVSIGMFEHVGYKNYQGYMDTVQRILKQDGLFLLHCIGGNHSAIVADPWIDKYIFPNGMIPSIFQIDKATQGKLILEDWHNIGLHYDRTLMEWLRRFTKSWPQLNDKYDQRFYNMWVYYLSCSAASFRAKSNNVWQIVFSQRSSRNAYQSVR